MRLSHKIEEKGFPDDYAELFVSRVEPMLDKLDEEDRLIVEAYIPTILELGEECWLPSLPSTSRLDDLVLDPSRKAQGDGNRE